MLEICSQVIALYQLANQYQVQSALTNLQALAQQTKLTIEDLKLLMPQAAALGDTASRAASDLCPARSTACGADLAPA
jgi:hypothetical protein